MLLHALLNNPSRRNRITACAALTLLFLIFNLSAWGAPGDLDPTFAGSGISPSLDLGSYEGSKRMVVQPDGKIVVGGSVIQGNFPSFRFKLARFYPNGLVDTSFGTNGVVVTQLTGYQNTGITFGDIDLLPDGKIILVGSAQVPNPNNPFINRTNMFVLRYNSNGSLDTTFNGTGIFTSGVGGLVTTGEAIVVQPDGKFIVVGHCGGSVKGNAPPYKILLYRFSENNLDTTFGSGGRVLTEIQNYDLYTYRIALRPDGKILVSGYFRTGNTVGFVLARYDANGSLDAGFGSNGMVFINEPGFYLTVPAALLIQPDGKILSVSTYNGNGNFADFVLLRFNEDGTLDTSFGTNGKVITTITNIKDTATGAALQPDGKIVVSGITTNYSTGGNSAPRSNGLLVRYNPNGSLDAGFGTGGIVKTSSNSFLNDVFILPNRKILALSRNFSVLRFLGDAPLVINRTSFDFDGDGWADFAVTRNIGGKLNWFAAENPSSIDIVETEWGLTTDKIVPADYDGDNKTDVAVFRPSNGNWYIVNSSNGTVSIIHFGQNGDFPMPADYDGDARADTAVYRQGDWYILNSSNNTFRAERFGIATDKPVIADFDGDGRADLSVYRGGVWYSLRSTAGFFAANFGVSDDIPVPADYDGDRVTDLAVYRASNGTWYLQNTVEGFKSFQFGIATDIPVPADYDADGKVDLAVYRDGNWYLQQSASGFRAVQYGQANDRPIPSAFAP